MSDTEQISHSICLLVNLLNYINKDDSIQVTNNYYDINHPLIIAALYLANEILISDDGHPDRNNIDTIVKAGFPIFPGEQDSFGWITICIQLSHGIIENRTDLDG